MRRMKKKQYGLACCDAVHLSGALWRHFGVKIQHGSESSCLCLHLVASGTASGQEGSS